jgi:hypothetical protein
MKISIVLFLIASVVLGGCKNSTTSVETTYYGEEFSNENVVTANQVAGITASTNSYDAVVEGKVVDVCQKKGCWMKIDIGNGETMHVTFKDYGFFVPMDITGRTVVMKGVSSFDTLSVETLRHYAYDAEKSDEEIEAITEPELSLTFEATGVFLKEDQ